MIREIRYALVFLLLSIGVLVVSTAPANADVTCTETIEPLIVHSDGTIFFTTSGTCISVWCEINWSNTNLANQAYAMMLSAVNSGQPLVFDWPNISSCSVQNVYQASPTYIYVTAGSQP